MFVYLSKKIAIPNDIWIRTIAWNKEHGYIACGGDNGLLKVLKLDLGKEGKIRGVAAPSNLSMNQTLEGHSGTIEVVTWNETYQKMTSSDQNGLIIVWMLYKGSWYEEMINNRNKSVVKGMAWNSDGQMICIVYEDGAVIVGSVDGNRIWGKELKGTHLNHVEWSPDGKLLLFGMQNGEIHIYEQSGNFVAKLNLLCLRNVSSISLIGIQWYNGKGGLYEVGCPTLAIGYNNGKVQLMKDENDDNPIILDTDISATCLRWNHDGSILAITGKLYNSDADKRNVVKFYSPYGKLLHTLRVPGRDISACTWEGRGLRIALAVDSFIFFANIRPDYKWCYFSNIVAYSYNKSDRSDNTVIFWNTNSDEKYIKYVKCLLGIVSEGEFCVLATKADDGSGQYALILCNAIGTPVDSRYIDIEPTFLAMTNSHIFAASKEAFYQWHFHTPQGQTVFELTSQRIKIGQEKLYHVDDMPSGATDVMKDVEHVYKPTDNPISCICASDKILIIGRESGNFQKYTLPHLALTHRYNLDCHPIKISLNCNSSRMSIIDISGILLLYNLNSSEPTSVDDSTGEQLNFERKDVWDVKWAKDNSEMFAVMEKTRMYIFRNLDPEEPVMCSGYLCTFEDLQVKTVLLDEVFQNPNNPISEYIVKYEVKSLRDTRDLLEQVGIAEASQFIEDNSHPRLWRLLAEAALKKLNLDTAESAFVRCQDYQGIQFVKRLATLQSIDMKKAEILSYFHQFDDAEELYMKMDRRDLAISLRRQLGDWFRVVQLLKSGSSGVDDRQLEEAWNAIGDYYADRQKWESAVTYYEQGHNQERLSECYYMLEDYDGLERLLNSLPDNHKLLTELGSMFSSVGMCEQAVNAYLKANKIKSAIDCCVTLNQWHTAISLAQQFNIQEIDGLVSKYAHYLLEKKKPLSAVELYRKANKFLDAAKIMQKLAVEEAKKNSSLVRIKKMFVLAAMLVEDHQAYIRKSSKQTEDKEDREIALALDALLDDEAVMSTDPKLIDQPWHGAEAFHFLMLAQRQLYEGHFDAAMRTALHLREYEDVLNQEVLYSVLALASCANRAFGTCSKAFIKLESLDQLNSERKEEYADLALEIFMKHSPKDSRNNKAECTSCETMIPDWCNICPSCSTKFPICVATGRPLMDPRQQWVCNYCKHSAFTQDMLNRQFCYLCYSSVNI